MAKTRSEIHREKCQQEYLDNSKAILYFCLSNGMSESTALYFSTKSINIKNFQWFYHQVKGNEKRLTFALESHLNKVERNKEAGMWNCIDPGEPEEPEIDPNSPPPPSQDYCI
jgi:hypothetical protein